MAYYSGNSTNRAGVHEVLVYEQTTNNATTASGVQNSIWDLPAGAYYVGAAVSTSSANSTAATVKLFVFQTANQTTAAAAMSVAMQFVPHGSTTAATVLTAPTSATYAGTSGMISLGTNAGQAPIFVPYGLLIRTTCNTNVGTRTVKIIAQQV